jgi:hypothetical protein
MIFYREKLTLSTSTSSLNFPSTNVGNTSNLNFNVSASSGNNIELVTVTDNSGEFSFSPSNFTLTKSSIQIVTASFTPTSSGTKTGILTLSSSGGSVRTLPMTGSGASAALNLQANIGGFGGYQESITDFDMFFVPRSYNIRALGTGTEGITIFSNTNGMFFASLSDSSITGGGLDVIMSVSYSGFGSASTQITVRATGGDTIVFNISKT